MSFVNWYVSLGIKQFSINSSVKSAVLVNHY